MALEVIRDCEFIGPALPEPFVLFELEPQLNKLGVLPKALGEEGAALRRSWEVYRRGFRALGPGSGSIRVRNHVLEPLVSHLGYDHLERSEAVPTRDEPKGEAGGYVFLAEDGTARLRCWTADFAADLDAPVKRGAAYRYSALQIARRVLLASNERVGLVTNGVELRLVLSDPARRDSQVIFSLDNWRRYHQVPDSFRLLVALCSPKGVAAVPQLTDRARLMQAQVTKDLRVQARQAIERFVQEVLDHPGNAQALAAADREALPRELWREGLIVIYRLLFILKLEGSPDPARVFSFASSSLWRNTYSPSAALAPIARQVLDAGAETGNVLEEGLRALFRMFVDGVDCTELRVRPLGGALFGQEATPWLSRLQWGERAVAHLLDRLLWTETKREGRKRVHYGPLDVEDLGRVYEALLELEPGIAAEPMCRLRRAKLEVVVPVAQGERYCAAAPVAASPGPPEDDEWDDVDETDAEPDEQEDETRSRGKKTRVGWIEEIPEGRFYLRVGLGRKASGSYYTPDSFVRFLVQETLGPQVEERSPQDNPDPAAILRLKVLDPAMGSGHFLVGACRFLADKLYEAARLCDERAQAAEARASEAGITADKRDALVGQAAEWRRKVIDLPDPDDELAAYMPSRAPEGAESGFSQARALAICRRLVAVHCLYGVDQNPLAVELARLSLWLESQAEGFPLTFLDHRLVVGDSLTGPFWTHLVQYPASGKQMAHLWIRNGEVVMAKRLQEALRCVGLLEENVGKDTAENARKAELKRELDHALTPFRVLAAAWSGGVMLGPSRCDDDAYEKLAEIVMDTGDLPAALPGGETLREMLAVGLGIAAASVPATGTALRALVETSATVPALAYDLAFPEVFYPTGVPWDRRGFDAVVGNPPWDAIHFKSKEFLAGFDLAILDAETRAQADAVEQRLLSSPRCAELFAGEQNAFERAKRANDRLYTYQKVEVGGDLAGRQIDAFRVFMERGALVLCSGGYVGWLVPSAFHANEGATGVRRLYLERMRLRCCYSFENRRKLFEIDSRFKFATVVASKCDAGTATFACAFYLHDDGWLHSREAEGTEYTIDFVRRTGGQYLSLLELRGADDLRVASVMSSAPHDFSGYLVDHAVGFRMTELHMTHDAPRFAGAASVVPLADPRVPEITRRVVELGYGVLHEGKTYHQYRDQWGPAPRYLVSLGRLADRAYLVDLGRHYRLAFRAVARATDERTVIACVLPPGCWCGHTSPIEECPEGRPTASALLLLALMNTFGFDCLARQRVQASIGLYMLEGIRVPNVSAAERLLVHSSSRLSCNHVGYEALWREQFGTAWREATPPLTWPVLATDGERWEVRAAIDAIVADAYGLSRAQYEHVLSTFSHRSFPKAPALCLARFDELKAVGQEAFARKYDPYWDIPLNENLPQPVIDLPVPGASADGPTNLLGEPLPVNLLGEVEYNRSRGRRRSR